MGQCLGGERERETKKYAYPCYDWLGEHTKESSKVSTETRAKPTREVTTRSTAKPTKEVLTRSTEIVELTGEIIKNSIDTVQFTDTILSVDLKTVPGSDKKQFVVTTNSRNLKDLGPISFTFRMGQCTSVNKGDHSIEEEPYAVAPSARRSEPEVRYRSKYTPYVWDIYVDTDDTPVRKKSKSYDSLKWNIYAQPEKVIKAPVKEEKQTYGNLYDPKKHDTNGNVTPDLPNGRVRPGESLYDPNSEGPRRNSSQNGSLRYRRGSDNTSVKEIEATLSRGLEDGSPRKPSSDDTYSQPDLPRRRQTENTPRRQGPENNGLKESDWSPVLTRNRSDEQARNPIAIRAEMEEVPRNTVEVRNETPRGAGTTAPNGKDMHTSPNNNRVNTIDLPRTNNTIHKEMPKKANTINGATEELPRNRVPDTDETSVKRVPVNGDPERTSSKQVYGGPSDTDDDDVEDYNDLPFEDQPEKYAPPHYHELVPLKTTSVIQYNTVPRVVKPSTEDTKSVPEKPDQSKSLYKPNISDGPKRLDEPKHFDKSKKLDEPKYLYEPKHIDKPNGFPETKQPIRSPEEKGQNGSTENKVRNTSPELNSVGVPHVNHQPNNSPERKLSNSSPDKGLTNGFPQTSPVKVSPERKPSESPTRVNDTPVSDKNPVTNGTPHVVKADIPKTVSRLLNTSTPSDTKGKNPDDDISPTALMKNPIHVRNVGTRPEKDDIKATVLLPAKFPQLFSGKRNAWRGLLLFGPAGSGKASLATAVAKEIGHSYTTLRSFISHNNFNGNCVSAMFKKARDNTPHVIIIDHLDGLSSAEIRELHKQMTSSSDEDFEGLLVVGITDTPWLLDKAVVELFEKRIFITLPSAASRAELFRENFAQSPHNLTEEDFIELGAWSEGYTCADIITVVNETLMHSMRRIKDATYFKKVNAKDLETSRFVDLYTPCSPGETGAIEMDWTRVPEKKLQEPLIRLSDVLVALRTQKPSLNPDDIEKHKQFAKRFTQHS